MNSAFYMAWNGSPVLSKKVVARPCTGHERMESGAAASKKVQYLRLTPPRARACLNARVFSAYDECNVNDFFPFTPHNEPRATVEQGKNSGSRCEYLFSSSMSLQYRGCRKYYRANRAIVTSDCPNRAQCAIGRQLALFVDRALHLRWTDLFSLRFKIALTE